MAQDAPQTLLQRMLAAGISEDNARSAIAGGQIRTGEDIIRDPDQPAPWPTGSGSADHHSRQGRM